MAEQKLPKQEVFADFRHPPIKIPSLSSDRRGAFLKTPVPAPFAIVTATRRAKTAKPVECEAWQSGGCKPHRPSYVYIELLREVF